MNKLTYLTKTDVAIVRGGAAASAGDDSLARDIGQYVGGFYGFNLEHPILANLPLFGSLFSNLAAFRTMTQ